MSTTPQAADPAVLAAPSRIVVPRPDDTTFIKALARGVADASIMLARKGPPGPEGRDEWQEFGSFELAELDTMFPAVVRSVLGDRDVFQTPTLFWRPGRGRSRYAPMLARAFRRTINVQWLTCAWCDLDCGRPGRPSQGQTLGAIFDAQARGIIPTPTLFLFSGQGVWPFWLLRNGSDDPRYPADGPVRAWPENIKTWQRVERALHDRLAALCSDPDALDVVHVCRIPGSLNTKSGRRVGYVLLLDPDGKPFSHTLRGLCGFLRLPLRTVPDELRAMCSPEEEEERRRRALRGSVGRYRLAVEQFYALEDLRGGWREGTRWRACRLLSMCLTRSRAQHGMADDAIRAEVLRVASRCRTADGRAPLPLPEAEALDAWEKGRVRGPGNPRNVVISTWLDVAPAEAAELVSWKAAPRFGPTPVEPEPPTREDLRDRRRELIRLCVEGRRTFPTLAQLGAALEPYGMTASPLTLLRDLRALRLDNPRGRAHRTKQLTIPGSVGTTASDSAMLTLEAREGGVSGPCPDPGPAPPPEAAREARRPEAPPSPTERAPREAQRPERRAVTTGVPTDAPRVQTAIPGEAEVPVPDLEAEDRERERQAREAQRLEQDAQREAEQRAADDLAQRQQEIHTGNHPGHTQDTPEARPATAGTARPRRPTAAERRNAEHVARMLAEVDDRHAARRLEHEAECQRFAAEVAAARKALEHLNHWTTRRTVAG